MSSNQPIVAIFKHHGKNDKNRGWYTSQNVEHGDYLRYVDTGSKKGQYLDYIDYSGNKEKSSGAFSRNGLLTNQEKAEIRAMLKTTGSCVWDCVISTEEWLGKDFMNDYRIAKKVIEEVLPSFLKANDMDYSNIVWFAGLHQNTDNRHIHLSFFQKEQERWKAKPGKRRHSGKHWHKPKLKKESFEKFKVDIYDCLMTFKKDKSAFKDVREELAKADVAKFRDYSEEFKGYLLDVYRSLPDENYQGIFYSSKELKDRTRFALDWASQAFLKLNPELNKKYLKLLDNLHQKDLNTKKYCNLRGIDPTPYLLEKKFILDFNRRVGNKILSHCKNAKALEVSDQYKIKAETRVRWNEKKRRSYLFKKATQLMKKVKEEEMKTFVEFEALMAKAEFDRLVEQGYLDINGSVTKEAELG